VTTLHDVHVRAEIDLDGMPYFRKEWHKSHLPERCIDSME
jgi:hypothetical protein